jgi:hypothetical protein
MDQRLQVSKAYTLANYETINDKVLREMNERAKGKQSKTTCLSTSPLTMPRLIPICLNSVLSYKEPERLGLRGFSDG